MHILQHVSSARGIFVSWFVAISQIYRVHREMPFYFAIIIYWVIIMCYGHIPLTPLSLSVPIWSTLPTNLSSNDQGQLSTLCSCHVQILAVLNKTEKKRSQGLFRVLTNALQSRKVTWSRLLRMALQALHCLTSGGIIYRDWERNRIP